MAGKARVHELAKELGVTSKELLATLKEQGEFVKSASSTVEAPVARRLRETFGTKSDSKAGKKADDKPRSQPAAGNGAAAAPKPSGPTPSTAARPGPPAKPAPAAAAPTPSAPVKPSAPKPAAPQPPAMSAPAPEPPRGRHSAPAAAGDRGRPGAQPAPVLATEPAEPPPPPQPERASRHRSDDEPTGQHADGQSAAELLARFQAAPTGGGRRRRRDE